MLTELQTGTAFATVEGRFTVPEVWVSAGFNDRHPENGKFLREVFKALPGARWDKTRKQWLITGVPANPDTWFAEAGIRVHIDQTCHPGVNSLQELWTPMSMLAENGRQALIRPRLAGFVTTEFLLGWGASWDKTEKMFTIPVTDVYQNGSPRPGVFWDQPSLDAAYLALTTSPIVVGWEQLAADLSAAASVDDSMLQQLGESYAGLPEWWKRDPFAYQLPGAYGALLGHRLICDPPGLGKTLQAIAAAAICGAKRILIACPPLLAVNWGREFVKCGYPGTIAVFRAGRKAPPIPDEGVVIVPESLLRSRPELRQQLMDWKPQFFSTDEAHRMRNPDSKQSRVNLDIAALVRANGGVSIPLTGTPIISGAHELVPMLEYAGLLGPIFGGTDAFLRRFCSRDPWGKFSSKKSSLEELHSLLKQHCWVRRSKAEVLPWLPPKFHTAVELEVDTKPYREAHHEVIAAVEEWFDAYFEANEGLPDDDDIEAFAESNLGLITKLRVASAVCKIPTAIEMVAEHLNSDPDNEHPLVVWVHHQEMSLAVAEQLEELEVRYGMLVGGMSDSKRNAVVDQFQAGELQVIVASITAAGVGVTLTRGRHALFVETDWTPANVTQAIDRQHRIGQEGPVLARTLIAMGTLDERIQKVQKQKQDIAGAITGDDQANVALLTGQDLISPRDIVRELAVQVVKDRKLLMLAV